MSGFNDRPTRPDGRIVIGLDSGANIKSTRWEIVTPEELGCESRAEWDELTDDEKLEAVQDFFYAAGYPEWSWDDGSN